MRKRKYVNYPNNPNQKQTDALHKYLHNIYFTPSAGASFLSPNSLLKEVQSRNYYKNVKLKDIEDFLSGESAYTLYKPFKKINHHLPLYVKTLNEQMQTGRLFHS